MIQPSGVLVIVGSVRAQRICPAVAQWVAQIGRESGLQELEVVDLKDWPLPMDDEPGVPAVHDYTSEHTRAWSRKISGAGAFVFVTPQFNWGYPASLKNALDHLYKEWAGKPAMIVTYGGHGGDKCASQLRQVLKGLKMRPVAANPRLRLSHEAIKANGAIEPGVVFAKYEGTIRAAFGQLDTALNRKRWLWRF